jgi:hypothetical protein
MQTWQSVRTVVGRRTRCRVAALRHGPRQPSRPLPLPQAWRSRLRPSRPRPGSPHPTSRP